MVYEMQIATSAYGYAPDRRDPPLFQFVLVATPGHTTAELEDAVYAQIEEMKNYPVTPEELEKAKNNIRADFYYGQQSNQGLAGRIADYEGIGVGWEYANTYADIIARVTADDIMRVAKTWFTATNRTVAVLVTEDGK